MTMHINHVDKAYYVVETLVLATQATSLLSHTYIIHNLQTNQPTAPSLDRLFVRCFD